MLMEGFLVDHIVTVNRGKMCAEHGAPKNIDDVKAFPTCSHA